MRNITQRREAGRAATSSLSSVDYWGSVASSRYTEHHGLAREGRSPRRLRNATSGTVPRRSRWR